MSQDEASLTTGFFRNYWATYDAELTNYQERRWRVNDTQMSLNPKYGDRAEAHANGLMTLKLPENLRTLREVELYLELWGGHPHTANKRLTLNGKGSYDLPEVGAAQGHCVYSYPSLPLDTLHLVSGTNALQFSCDRGESFWGHFIIDNAAFRCFLADDHPDLEGLESFEARVAAEQKGHRLELSLEVSNDSPDIESIDYFGYYYGFDDRGKGSELSWHGFTQKKEPINHLGTVQATSDTLSWDLGELDSRNERVSVCAVIHFAGELKYRTEVTEVELTSLGKKVKLVCCSDMPAPFWSRDSQKKVATFWLEDISALAKARLQVKIWDGGEGDVENPFTINGHAYTVASGKAVHDVVFSKLEVDPAHLREGQNEVVLISDTEHHGIEIILPGPCLTLTYNYQQ